MFSPTGYSRATSLPSNGDFSLLQKQVKIFQTWKIFLFPSNDQIIFKLVILVSTITDLHI